MVRFLKVIGFIALYMALYIVVQVAAGMVFAAVYTVRQLLSGHEQTDSTSLIKGSEAFLTDYTPIILIIAVIMTFSVYYLIGYLRKQSVFSTCGFKKISFSKAIITALVGISCNFLIGLLIAIIQQLGFLESALTNHDELMNTIMGSSFFILVLLDVGILGPVFEEVLFRGLVYNELKGIMPVIPAILVQAFLFGAYHMNIIQGIYGFLLGIVLGLVCVWSKSIWASIIVHMSINTSSAILSRLGDTQFFNNYGGIIMLASIFIAVYGMAYLWRSRLPAA